MMANIFPCLIPPLTLCRICLSSRHAQIFLNSKSSPISLFCVPILKLQWQFYTNCWERGGFLPLYSRFFMLWILISVKVDCCFQHLRPQAYYLTTSRQNVDVLGTLNCNYKFTFVGRTLICGCFHQYSCNCYWRTTVTTGEIIHG